MAGKYKVQAYDGNIKGYMPVQKNVGMHVEIKDPDSKMILSRVSLVVNGAVVIQNFYDISGNYKVQAYDYNVKEYMPVTAEIGMLVQVTDPDEKVVLSRVSLYFLSLFIQEAIRFKPMIVM